MAAFSRVEVRCKLMARCNYYAHHQSTDVLISRVPTCKLPICWSAASLQLLSFELEVPPFKAYIFEEGYLVEVGSEEWWMAMEGRFNEYLI